MKAEYQKWINDNIKDPKVRKALEKTQDHPATRFFLNAKTKP